MSPFINLVNQHPCMDVYGLDAQACALVYPKFTINSATTVLTTVTYFAKPSSTALAQSDKLSIIYLEFTKSHYDPAHFSLMGVVNIFEVFFFCNVILSGRHRGGSRLPKRRVPLWSIVIASSVFMI